MRKWIALALALVQLAFGGFLIANGGKKDRAVQRHIDEILENGSELLFDLDGFSYQRRTDFEEPINFVIYDNGWDYEYPYFPVTVSKNGVAVFGKSTDAPAGDLYYAPFAGEVFYRLDEDALETLFASQDDDWKYYNRNWLQPEKNRFLIGDDWVPVYAVGTLWRGDIVYTGIMVDGVRY